MFADGFWMGCCSAVLPDIMIMSCRLIRGPAVRSHTDMLATGAYQMSQVPLLPSPQNGGGGLSTPPWALNTTGLVRV